MAPHNESDFADPARKRPLLWNAVALAFGWTSFFYWWWVVFHRAGGEIVVRLVISLLILISFVVAFSLFWILHNLRLARRGHRDRATPYNPGLVDRDRLDREMVLGDVDALRDANVVLVHATEKQKLYREGESEDGGR